MIDFTKVIDAYPEANTFIVELGYGDPCNRCVDKIELSPPIFNQQLFLYRKYLKAQTRPEDRVAGFESKDSNGVFSLDKYDRVLKSRLKPGETHDRNPVLRHQANITEQMYAVNSSRQSSHH